MSKKSRRRNKILLGAAALFGASKLGLLGGKTQITGATGKNKRLFTDIAKTGVAPQKEFGQRTVLSVDHSRVVASNP